jgi:hypothetical protein
LGEVVSLVFSLWEKKLRNRNSSPFEGFVGRSKFRDRVDKIIKFRERVG